VSDHRDPTVTWAEARPVAPASQSAIAAATVFADACLTVPSRSCAGSHSTANYHGFARSWQCACAALLELPMLLSPAAASAAYTLLAKPTSASRPRLPPRGRAQRHRPRDECFEA